MPPRVDTSKVIDLRTTAAACVEYLAPLAIGRGRALGFEAPEGRPVQVHGDAGAVTDALRNLIENAVTYAPVGTEVTITVDPMGQVSVSDRGPGVAPDDRAHVFERFWRGRGASYGRRSRPRHCCRNRTRSWRHGRGRSSDRWRSAFYPKAPPRLNPPKACSERTTPLRQSLSVSGVTAPVCS